MTSTDELVAQIERVLAKFPKVADSWRTDRTLAGFTDTVAFSALRTECIALGSFIYGARHPQARMIANTISHETLHHLQSTEGILRGTIEAIRHGLLSELRTQVLLDIKADFIEAGSNALQSGALEVAAVLAAVVLEDSTKRLAEKQELSSALNQEFSVVVVELFKSGAITKGTKGVLLGFKDLRNAALHAQWKEVSPEAVRGLLQFLPMFMEQHGV